LTHRLFVLFVLTLSCLYLTAQSESIIIRLGDKDYQSLQDLLIEVESNSPYSFSYNANAIPLDKPVSLLSENLSLSEILENISLHFSLVCSVDDKSMKILLRPQNALKLYGLILDALSGESIMGATIVTNDTYLGSSGENGYFNIVRPTQFNSAELSIYAIGYDPQMIDLGKLEKDELVIQLIPRQDIEVIIRPGEEFEFSTTNAISVQALKSHFGTAGNNDLIQAVKFKSGVSPGSEGQNGYISRGGTPHQNLILVDDMPIYEASHLGGLSSIFLPDAIKSIELFKSEFPARYGGRVSSVLDVRLKDGNRKEFSRSIAAGLEGMTAHLDGPISRNTSININGRLSWFTEFARPVVRNYTDVTDLNLNYRDLYAKITHWLSGTSRISFSTYLGEDLVRILRDKKDDLNTGFRDLNKIEWGNKFASLSWHQLISDNINLKINAGTSSYDYTSRGSYEVIYEAMNTLEDREFDILSVSELRDKSLKLELDIYTNVKGRFRLGAEFTNHANRPSITEREIFADEDEEILLVDTLYSAQFFNVYAENRIDLNSNLELTAGARWSNYFINEKHYNYLEPRIKLAYRNSGIQWSINYTRASQFIHLLSNPGPGLPSELWVPSTPRVPPELSHNISLQLSRPSHTLSFGGALWFRRFSNLIEYSNSTDIIYSIIIDNELYQVEVDNTNWENRVSTGTGRAYGFDLWTAFSIGKFDAKTNYTIGRSERQFENIDAGVYFPSKFDTPHLFSSQLLYNISENKSLLFNWQYTTGTTYSLLDTEQLTPDGRSVLVPSSRNNFRLPDFHHLDIHYRVYKSLEQGELKIDIGIYNIYNRLNAFYEYLSQDTEQAAAELVKISIYPILPQFNLSYSW